MTTFSYTHQLTRLLVVSSVQQTCTCDTFEMYFICHTSDTAALQKAAATWILKTRESHRIPMSVMDSIIQDVQSLYEIALAQLSGGVQRILHDAGVTSSVQDTVAREFTDGVSTHMFTGLSTFSQQMTYFKQHFNLIVGC